MRLVLLLAAMMVTAVWFWLTIDWFWYHPDMTKPEYFWFRLWWYVGTAVGSCVLLPAMKLYED